MSTLVEAAAACCACLRAHWVTSPGPDGTVSGRWLCTQCRREFAPGSQADAALLQRLLEVLAREVGKTGESEGAVDVAERLLRERNEARADLATAANVLTKLEAEASAESDLVDALQVELNVVREQVVELSVDTEEFKSYLQWFGNVVCAIAFDNERHNTHAAEHSTCAFCGQEGLRHGEAMQAHAAACEQHPLGAALKERDAALAEVESLKADRRARFAAILGTIGGTVEGTPTQSINFLQRLRQLVAAEAALKAALPALEEDVEELTDLVKYDDSGDPNGPIAVAVAQDRLDAARAALVAGHTKISR